MTQATPPTKGPQTGTLFWLPVILDAEQLDPVETLILLALADHVNGEDECFVGIDELAQRGRCSYSTAQRRLKSLTTRGTLDRVRRRRTDGNLSVYEYRLSRAFFGLLPVNLTGDHRSAGRPVTTGHLGDRAEPPHKDSAPSELLEGFDAFWEPYPRKVEKAAARSAWKARRKAGVSADEMIQASENYADACAVRRTEPAFVKHPATFIGVKEPWKDYLDGGEALAAVVAIDPRSSADPAERAAAYGTFIADRSRPAWMDPKGA